MSQCKCADVVTRLKAQGKTVEIGENQYLLLSHNVATATGCALIDTLRLARSDDFIKRHVDFVRHLAT